ncbi:MAG: hypothetical protein WBA93_13150 [Microcoleaceae cyanobacterium]
MNHQTFIPASLFTLSTLTIFLNVDFADVKVDEIPSHKSYVCSSFNLVFITQKLSKTYVSERLNFQISYPQSYVVDNSFENQYPDEGYIYLYTKADYPAIQEGKLLERVSNIGIYVYKNSQGFSPLNWVEQNEAKSNFKIKTDDYKELQFVGQSAMSYTWCGLTCADNIIFTSQNTKFIFIFSVFYDNQSESIRQDFMKIIASFQFSQ